jgi:branched-chain amino acid transport system ATP-binding protein
MLKLSNVNTFYGNIHALKGMSLEVNQGEIVTLIGSNGAGKTTTLKTIMGLLKPESGKIEFEGQEIKGLKPDKIVSSGITLVPEGRQVFPFMSVFENLEMGAYSRKSKQEVKLNLERVYSLFPKLLDRKGQQAGTLSGGEQQMLAMARALMSQPKLMLLDEPSLGLAPKLVDTIFELIKEINKQGITVLLIEQNARMALMTATRGYVLETGRVVLSDMAQNLLNSDQVRKAYLGE